MGKVVKITGCRLLGAELKRLRGVRTQQDIVQLSRSLPAQDFERIFGGQP